MANNGLGFVLALTVSVLLVTATLKMPVYRAFQITTLLLILFAAGLVGRGVHEFTEIGVLPQLREITFTFFPPAGHIAGDIFNVLFGWSRTMNYLELVSYVAYIAFMRWYLFLRNPPTAITE